MRVTPHHRPDRPRRRRRSCTRRARPTPTAIAIGVAIAAALTLLGCGGDTTEATDASDRTSTEVAAPTAETGTAATAPPTSPEPTPSPTAAPVASATAAPEPADVSEPEPTEAAPPPSATAQPTVATRPLDPVSGSPGVVAMTRLVDWFNAEPPLPEEYETVFSAEMIDALPYDDFLALHLQFRAGAPWTLIEPEDDGIEATARLRDASAVERARMNVYVQDGLIAGLFFVPLEAEQPGTRAETVEALGALGTFTWFTADDAGCAATDGTADTFDDPVPIASIFKLYVLGALIDAVDDGSTTWDTSVEIRDELDSLPSGTTQTEEPGSMLTLRELAERMITISDNTATDHLIEHLGREAIEAGLADWGHSRPELMTPLILTADLFKMKFGDDDTARAEWGAWSEDERRAHLDSLADVPLPDLTSIGAVEPSPALEWFATLPDLCRVIGMLHGDEIGREILALPSLTNSGNAALAWEGSKGGSEPSVLAAAWAADPGDGTPRIVVASLIGAGELSFDAYDLFDTFRDQSWAAVLNR